MSLELEQKIKEKFPKLEFGELQQIDNSSERIMVDNVAFRYPQSRREVNDALNTLQESVNGCLVIYEAEDVADAFNRRLEEQVSNFNEEETALVFAGSGARDVKELVDTYVLRNFRVLSVGARRIVDDRLKVQGVEIITLGEGVLRGSRVRRCVLLDDVVASGATAEAVRAYIDREGEFEWWGGAWMSLSPLQAKGRKTVASSLVGYDKTFAEVVYQGKSGIPANNSLSTFGGVDEKSRAVIARYEERNVVDQRLYRLAIKALRRIINE